MLKIAWKKKVWKILHNLMNTGNTFHRNIISVFSFYFPSPVWIFSAVLDVTIEINSVYGTTDE